MKLHSRRLLSGISERKRIVVDDFDLEGIRRAVHEFYSDKKYPTLESLLALLKERGLFDGERVKHLSMLALPGEVWQSRGFDLIRIQLPHPPGKIQIQIPSSYMGIQMARASIYCYIVI